ncbi:hypothetical protein DRQ25_12020 [Candidatus Fermentibacteria bacterium]|nr:MAG: hypothetical protein DRQ25_12020 [Candidatus Fermentibacteria bacterium]
MKLLDHNIALKLAKGYLTTTAFFYSRELKKLYVERGYTHYRRNTDGKVVVIGSGVIGRITAKLKKEGLIKKNTRSRNRIRWEVLR